MIVRIKGVKEVRTKRGTGTYYYHRRTGKPIVDDHGHHLVPGTLDFLEKVKALDAGQGPKPEEIERTVGGLIRGYRESPEFTELQPRTRADYQKVFDYLYPLRAMPIDMVTTAFILRTRDKAFRKRKRRFANYTVQVWSILLGWGKPRGYVEKNHAEDVPMIRRPKGMARANRPWEPHERDIVLAEAPAALKIPVALGIYAAPREADVIRFPKSGYKDGQVRWTAGKNDREIWFPAHPRLREILATAPKDATIFCLNSRGLPWTQSGFRASFFKFVRKLMAAGKVGPGLTFHGLRHTLGDELAEAGCDTRDIAAVLGITEKMAEHYSHGASLKKRATAAIKKLERTRK